jgi:hypothetical protein
MHGAPTLTAALKRAARATREGRPAPKVRLDRGGYDPDGRYWGAAINGTPPLFRAEADDGVEVREEYIRAWDRTGARAKLLKACPRLKFKR